MILYHELFEANEKLVPVTALDQPLVQILTVTPSGEYVSGLGVALSSNIVLSCEHLFIDGERTHCDLLYSTDPKDKVEIKGAFVEGSLTYLPSGQISKSLRMGRRYYNAIDERLVLLHVHKMDAKVNTLLARSLPDEDVQLWTAKGRKSNGSKVRKFCFSGITQYSRNSLICTESYSAPPKIVAVGDSGSGFFSGDKLVGIQHALVTRKNLDTVLGIPVTRSRNWIRQVQTLV